MEAASAQNNTKRQPNKKKNNQKLENEMLKFTGIDMSVERRIISLSRSPERSSRDGWRHIRSVYKT